LNLASFDFSSNHVLASRRCADENVFIFFIFSLPNLRLMTWILWITWNTWED